MICISFWKSLYVDCHDRKDEDRLLRKSSPLPRLDVVSRHHSKHKLPMGWFPQSYSYDVVKIWTWFWALVQNKMSLNPRKNIFSPLQRSTADVITWAFPWKQRQQSSRGFSHGREPYFPSSRQPYNSSADSLVMLFVGGTKQPDSKSKPSVLKVMALWS